jgi:predicted O-methyltransferase YrrM
VTEYNRNYYQKFEQHINKHKEFIRLINKDAAQDVSTIPVMLGILYAVYGLEGDMAEFGVWKGGSAKLIASHMNPRKTLFLFDTFEGIPEHTVGPKDENDKLSGAFKHQTSINIVKSYLSEYKNNIELVPGVFPESLDSMEMLYDQVFSFVHVDVDTYVSTKEALKFFYPRLICGGVIIVHDYGFKSTRGAMKAVNEFVHDSSSIFHSPYTRQGIIQKP